MIRLTIVNVICLLLFMACAANSGESASENSSDNSNASTEAVAIWSLGVQDGDFGFSACQTALTGKTTAIETQLASEGFTTAVTFSSTNVYDLLNVGTDSDGLGLADNSRSVYTYTHSSGTVTKTTTFSGSSVSLADMVSLAGGGWAANGDRVLTALGIDGGGTPNANSWWAFSNANGTYGVNCSAATDNTGANAGYIGGTAMLLGSTVSCDNTAHVLCIAK